MNSNLPWIEKYRPKNLLELISHDDIVHTLDKFIVNGKLPHLLFYGPPGTGKTSTILAISNQIYDEKQQKSMVLELNASDDRGIGVVRSEILTFASNQTLYRGKFKLIILDEADAMTKDAQNALRRIIEKYSESTRFCLICNYQNKIIPAIQSRCTRFRFSPLKIDQIQPRLLYIINEEKVNVSTDGVEALIRLSNGDMRQAINILQSTSMSFDAVNESNIYSCIGQPQPNDIKLILNILLNEDVNSCLSKLTEIRLDKSIALNDIITELHKMLIKVKFPDDVLMDLMIKLADIEKRLSLGCSEKLQSAALVSAFYLVREKIAAAAQ